MARNDIPTPPPAPDMMAHILSAEDLMRLVEHHEIQKAEENDHLKEAAREAKRHRVEMMLQRRELTPQMVEKAVNRWKNAAAQGATEVELLRFPSEVCTDDGRAINNGEAGWPRTLAGVPAQVYEIWERDLKPAGFKLKAYVVDFPDGKPGDIGMFLSWA